MNPPLLPLNPQLSCDRFTSAICPLIFGKDLCFYFSLSHCSYETCTFFAVSHTSSFRWLEKEHVEWTFRDRGSSMRPAHANCPVRNPIFFKPGQPTNPPQLWREWKRTWDSVTVNSNSNNRCRTTDIVPPPPKTTIHPLHKSDITLSSSSAIWRLFCRDGYENAISCQLSLYPFLDDFDNFLKIIANSTCIYV